MKLIKKSTLLFLFIITTCLAVFNVMADSGIKKNDQKLQIKVDQSGCAKSVDVISLVDNCQGSQFEGSCGKNGKDCVCMQNQKFVSWEITNGSRFELQFVGASPFKANCKEKSGNNAKIRCKIDSPDGDYEYNVIVETCPGQVYDPKIVIRTSGR